MTSERAQPSAPRTMAVCWCGTPLLWTFIFAGSEWLCLDCGKQLPMMDARRAEATAALIATHDALTAEFFAHVAGKILPTGARRRDCDGCATDRQHRDHATQNEIAADQEARRWLAARVTEPR